MGARKKHKYIRKGLFSGLTVAASVAGWAFLPPLSRPNLQLPGSFGLMFSGLPQSSYVEITMSFVPPAPTNITTTPAADIGTNTLTIEIANGVLNTTYEVDIQGDSVFCTEPIEPNGCPVFITINQGNPENLPHSYGVVTMQVRSKSPYGFSANGLDAEVMLPRVTVDVNPPVTFPVITEYDDFPDAIRYDWPPEFSPVPSASAVSFTQNTSPASPYNLPPTIFEATSSSRQQADTKDAFASGIAFGIAGGGLFASIDALLQDGDEKDDGEKDKSVLPDTASRAVPDGP